MFAREEHVDVLSVIHFQLQLRKFYNWVWETKTMPGGFIQIRVHGDTQFQLPWSPTCQLTTIHHRTPPSIRLQP